MPAEGGAGQGADGGGRGAGGRDGWAIRRCGRVGLGAGADLRAGRGRWFAVRMGGSHRRMGIVKTMHRIEAAEELDPVVGRLKPLVDRIPPGRLRDLLHGVPLGHPAHPILVQVPIGAWTSAVVLDLFPGTERAARLLVGVGLAAAVPAAVAGAVDWSEQHERHQRTGVVHAMANGAGAVLFAASALARARGRTGLGKALAVAGMGAVGAGGMLGGHIAYHLAGGANHADYAVDRLPEDWQEIGQAADFEENTPVHARLGDVGLVVVRSGERVHVLADTCTHLGGPLSEGETDGTCLTCPWHGSTFRLTDGAVVGGPATAAQPVLETEVRDGVVRVRRG